jgi:hypothetical protein
LQGVAAVHRQPVLVLAAQVDQEEEEEVIGMIHILQVEPQILEEVVGAVVLIMLPLLVAMAAQDLFLFGIH